MGAHKQEAHKQQCLWALGNSSSNCRHPAIGTRKRLLSFILHGIFTADPSCAIVYSEIRASPGKDQEMIHSDFSIFVKSQSNHLSLCCLDDKLHGPLACPYKMKDVKRQP